MVGIPQSWTGVPDEVAEALTEPGSEPAEGVPGLGNPRYHSATIPSDFEHRPGLQDAPTRFRTFGQMRRTSSAVMLGDRSLKRVVRKAAPVLLQGKRTSEASAAGISEQWGLNDFEGTGRLQQTAQEVAALGARALTDGAVFLAEQWALEEGRWWIKRYHLRHVSTFTDLYQDQRGEFVGFRQQVDGHSAFVPLRSCLYVVDEPAEGIFGVGINRAAEPGWRDEQSGLTKLRAAVHRFAYGTPKGSVRDLESWNALMALASGREGFDPNGDWFAPFRTAMVDQLRGYNANINGYLTEEFWQNITIEQADFDPSKLDSTILARQAEILRLYASAWLLMGAEGTSGAYNMVEVQAGQLLDLGDEALALVYEAINAQSNARWHAYNEPSIPRAERAALGYSLPRPKRKEEMQELAAAHAMGLFTSSTEDERHFRSTREWPEMPPEAEQMTPQERAGGVARRQARQVAGGTARDFIQQARAGARPQQDQEQGT